MRRTPFILVALLALAGGAPVAAQEPGTIVYDTRSVLAVVDPATPGFPVGSLMRADCAFAVRIVADDGSVQEYQACRLSDEPVMIPENQGTPPTTTLTYGSGPCVWTSDVIWATEDRPVHADAVEIVVLASGQVFVRSSYPAEPLVCEEPSPAP